MFQREIDLCELISAGHCETGSSTDVNTSQCLIYEVTTVKWNALLHEDSSVLVSTVWSCRRLWFVLLLKCYSMIQRLCTSATRGYLLRHLLYSIHHFDKLPVLLKVVERLDLAGQITRATHGDRQTLTATLAPAGNLELWHHLNTYVFRLWEEKLLHQMYLLHFKVILYVFINFIWLFYLFFYLFRQIFSRSCTFYSYFFTWLHLFTTVS